MGKTREPFGLRVATAPEAGAGHLARMRALAAALAPPVVVYADPDHGSGGTDCAWPGHVVVEDSASRMQNAVADLAERRIRGLVIDSYRLDEAEIAEAARTGPVVAFRDGPPYGSEHLTIDISPGTPAGARVLAGPAYAPLAPSFAARRAAGEGRRTREIRSVLVAFGARDNGNFTGIVLEGLLQMPVQMNVLVALGGSAPHGDRVRELAHGCSHVTVETDVADMSEQYARADLAVGAPGVSQYERACCGLPTVLVAQNPRQERLAEAWSDAGAAILSAATPAAVSRAVAALAQDRAARGSMRAKCLALVDGHGARRVALALDRLAA